MYMSYLTTRTILHGYLIINLTYYFNYLKGLLYNCQLLDLFINLSIVN